MSIQLSTDSVSFPQPQYHNSAVTSLATHTPSLPPSQVLQYLFSEVNYGGRITDDKDRRLNNNILESYICKESLHLKCKLSPSGNYIIPKYETQQVYAFSLSFRHTHTNLALEYMLTRAGNP